MAPLTRWLRRALTAGALALAAATPAPAAAQDAVQQAQVAELTRVRAAVANQVQLAAYDLIDEMVYGWIEAPLFANPTPVVLASVTVPTGLGSGMQALLENHISAVLTANPSTNVQLVHCPTCTAVVVHSGPEGTVLSRGFDNPAALDELGGGSGQHALFVDVEAEGAFLVLRARLTQLTPDLPIVWSHTLATSSSAPALLRQPDHLKSAAEARQEYLDALRDRGPILVPVRFVVRAYQGGRGQAVAAAPPFLWLQSGVELSPDQSHAWTGSLLVGYSFIPQAYQGLMGQARISRLLTGRVRSHTRPDLYAFAGGGVMSVWGPATASFRRRRLTADELLRDAETADPRHTLGILHAGLEARIGNRIGLSGFVETLPYLWRSPNMGAYLWAFGVPFQSIGTEVTFCF